MSITLRLSVIDESGAPVPGAIVRNDKASVTTGADGVATIGGIDTGFDSVTVEHPMPAEAQLLFSLGEGSSAPLGGTVARHSSSCSLRPAPSTVRSSRTPSCTAE